MRGISSRDISVVVQGPVTGRSSDAPALRLTQRAMESIRQFLPDAEVVFSTWAGADVQGLSFDRLLELEDPGGMRCDDGSLDMSIPWNTNRQIVSTREGLRAATRPFAMKLRSDMLLTGTGFLDQWGKYPARSEQWKLLSERVLTPTTYSRHPASSLPYPFHPSDWWHFGRREDLLNLWDIPLADAGVARWFDTHPAPHDLPQPWMRYRYTVEQYVWLAFLRKHGVIAFDHRADATPTTIALSELTIVNNLQFAELTELSVKFVKFPVSLIDWAALYTRGDWERMYQQYCDPMFVPSTDIRRMAKRAYATVAGPAHMLLASPASSPLASFVTRTWRKRFPGSFRVVKRAYISSMTAIGRMVRR